VNRRVIEALRAFSRSQKRQRFVEDEKSNVAHRRTCEMCTATEDDVTSKHCRMCGQKLAEIEGEDEVSQQFGFPDKSPHSASEDDDEDEDEDEPRTVYHRIGSDEDDSRRGAARAGYSNEAIKTFRTSYKRLRGV